MQISDIPKHMGVTASRLSDLIGVGRSTLNDYTRGRRGKPSEFVARLLQVSGLLREEVFFPDVFDHPDACDRNQPQYWIALAIEALREAKSRGLDCEEISETIYKIGMDHLPDIG